MNWNWAKQTIKHGKKIKRIKMASEEESDTK